MKTCKCCKQELPLSSFYEHSGCRDGYRPECKQCTCNNQKKHRAANTDKIKARQKRYRSNLQEKNKTYQHSDPIRCRVCKEVKPPSEFHNNKSRKTGKSDVCKCCCSIYQKGYRANNKEKIRISWKRWYESNKERVITQHREYYAANPEKRRTYMQQYQRKHRTRILALRRQWRQKNPDKISASTKSRRYQSDLMVKSLTPSEVSARNRIYLFRDFLNLLFPLTGYLFHVDHIVPLARGGTEHPDNLQILRDKENLSKGCKLAHEASLKPLPVPESFSGLLTMKLYSDLSKEVEIVEVYHLWIQHIKKYYDEHEIPDQDHPEEVVATQDVVVNQTVTVDTVTVETLVA